MHAFMIFTASLFQSPLHSVCIVLCLTHLFPSTQSREFGEEGTTREWRAIQWGIHIERNALVLAAMSVLSKQPVYSPLCAFLFSCKLLCITLTSNGIEENDISFRPVSLRELKHIWPVLILTMEPYISTNMICNFWCQSLFSNHLIFYIFPSHL